MTVQPCPGDKEGTAALWYPPAEQACFHFRAPALLEVVRAWRRRLALRVDDGAATAARSAPAEPLAPLVSRSCPAHAGVRG